MRTKFLLFLAVSFSSSCDFKSKPYIKHELKFEKLSGDCYNQKASVNVEANIIGERYIFEECLEASFNGEYNVERKGDTVEVKFGKAAEVRSLFRITLDINTRPTYHFLSINGNTIPVIVSRP